MDSSFWRLRGVRASAVFCFAFLAASFSTKAASTTVYAGGDLQGALNQAQAGDIINIQAGATFTGHYTLPANAGPNWIWIETANVNSGLPGVGARVSPSDAGNMPKLVSPDASPVLSITGGDHGYYRFVGIEFASSNGVYVQDLIQLGNGGENASNLLPFQVVLDRCYIHGSTSGGKRGVALNSRFATIENSYISGFTSTSQDTQAIEGWNGPGPYRIINNYLEAGTENVAFGGATPSNYGNIPSDILIAHNDIYKPTSWQSQGIWVKNLLELKNAQRVTIDSNNFTNNWVGADQKGIAMLLNVRDENGSVPWAVVKNITVTNNHFNHVGGGIIFMGHDGDGGGDGGFMTVKNNLFEDVGAFNCDGRLWEFLAGAHDITIDHNTAYQYGPLSWIEVYDGAVGGHVYATNNIVNQGQGIAGTGTGGGTATLNYYDATGSFTSNDVINGVSSQYPTGNNFPANSSSTTAGRGANLSAPVGLPTGWVYLLNLNSQLCMDTSNGPFTVGTGLIQNTCAQAASQKFQFTPVGTQGAYLITAFYSDWQLNIYQASGVDGQPIVIWPMGYTSGNPTGDFEWTLQDMNNGYDIFHSIAFPGSAMDVWGESTAPGAIITDYSNTNHANKQFQLVPVS